MFRMCTICLLVALLALAGCNKADSKKAPATKVATIPVASNDSTSEQPNNENQPTPEPGKPGKKGEGLTTMEGWEAKQDEDFPPLPQEDVDFIREELIRLAPENGFTYNESTNLITGGGLPETGLDLGVLVDKVEMEGRKSQVELTHEVLSKWCSGIFTELQPRAKSPVREKKETKQKRSGSGGGASKSSDDNSATTQQVSKSKLNFANSAVGEWKSIREEHPQITTYHNDKYFEYFRFLPDGVAELKYFRDGKMTLINEFTYNYSPRNGEISLFNKSKKLATTLILKMEPGNEEVLFIEFPDKDSITVYEKRGEGRLAKESDWLEDVGLSQ